ncbi:shikimate dehydrogenase [Calderihabitans maritimus]|uniref:Shikimate dehydrogenase (NADP(+)) n=1 Tax=Calderihabitans maritimus TaxID=1246530 RepID=A0A1Z5HX66_9FIRM|nr:shikimate dehydrogenase [Calderihabitans maritimus]GAW94123.1 shikimate 5-dehydrogenase [Calderihabitans maritimus]
MVTVDGKTKVVGLFGWPVEHSWSPLIHNAAFKAAGLNYVYVPFAVPPEKIAQALCSLPALNIRGINVTIPHKETVMNYLDWISPEAQMIGAVNTVVVEEDGKLKGYNTDGEGFMDSLREEAGIDPRGLTFTLLGAGGACRAVAVSLALKGARKINIANRTVSRAEAIVEIINRSTSARAQAFSLSERELTAALEESQVLVNTTPVGMYPRDKEPPLINPDLLRRTLLVCDLVYRPRETTLLREAALRGCRTLSGLGMLVAQAARSYRLWTGQEAPAEIMRETVSNLVR